MTPLPPTTGERAGGLFPTDFVQHDHPVVDAAVEAGITFALAVLVVAAARVAARRLAAAVRRSR